MSNPDTELLAAAIVGDRDALTELLQRYAAVLRARLEAQISPAHRALLEPDDVLQVTYLEAFLRIESFVPAGPGAFLGWLQQIARHNLLDAVRELERVKRMPPGHRIRAGGPADSAVSLVDQLFHTTTTPSRHLAARDVEHLVRTAVGQLPPDYRTVIERYELEGQPVELVATELGRSQGAVYMLRARALDRLREALASHFEFSRGDA